MSNLSTAGTATCARCGGARWPATLSTPYTCQRCGQSLAGGNAVDPLTGSVTGSRRRPGQKPPPPSANRHGAKTRGAA